MNIISRADWGARPPKRTSRMKARLDRIFVHWLGPAYPDHFSEEQMLQSAQRFHMNTRGWSDIAYSFAVGQSGKVYELRGLHTTGGHTFTENDDSYGILCLIGEGQKPSAEMLAAIPEVIEHIRLNHGPKPIHSSEIRVMGHRDDRRVDGAGTSTECPGPDLGKFAWEYVHSRDYVSSEAPAPVMSFTEATQFLGDLYVLLIGEPDTVGFNFWRDALMSGRAKRSDVVYAFAEVLGRAGR